MSLEMVAFFVVSSPEVHTLHFPGIKTAQCFGQHPQKRQKNVCRLDA